VILTGCLRLALKRLNPGVPAGTIESALLQLANPNVPGLLASNRNFHLWMTQGLPITYMAGNQQVGLKDLVVAMNLLNLLHQRRLHDVSIKLVVASFFAAPEQCFKRGSVWLGFVGAPATAIRRSFAERSA